MQKFPVRNVNAHVAFFESRSEEHEVARLQFGLGHLASSPSLLLRSTGYGHVELVRKYGLYEAGAVGALLGGAA